MNKLVRLWKRPSRDGKKFSFVLIYRDEQGRNRYESLGHTDRRKAERQQTQKERELRMGYVEPHSMRLSEFLEDSLRRSRTQVRQNTIRDYLSTMRHFIQVIGDMDYRAVKHQHGEKFIQACLDSGNRPGTVRKKIGNLKRIFQLAVERGQLEENPLRYVRKPKAAQRAVHVFRDEECERMIKVVREAQIHTPVRWDIFILTALCTGMRQGELLNTTWADIDFEKQLLKVSPKENTQYTWEWQIKDTDRRTVPLTEEVLKLLAEHQAEQPAGYPYVFIPPYRYDHIQRRRQQDRWTERNGKCPVNNLQRQFQLIQERASIDEGEFHDFRRTCLSNWLAHGLSEFDVMNMAGHASFQTTHRFYLAVREDLLQRARRASDQSLQGISVARALRAPQNEENKKGRQTQVLDSQEVTE